MAQKSHAVGRQLGGTVHAPSPTARWLNGRRCSCDQFRPKLIRDPDRPIGTHGHVSVSRRGGNACGRSRATRHWANRHESRRPRRRLPAVRPTSADQRSSSSRDGHIITSGWYGLSYSGARSPRCACPPFPSRPRISRPLYRRRDFEFCNRFDPLSDMRKSLI